MLPLLYKKKTYFSRKGNFQIWISRPASQVNYPNRLWRFQQKKSKKILTSKIVQLARPDIYASLIFYIVNGQIVHFHLSPLEYIKNVVAYFPQKSFRTTGETTEFKKKKFRIGIGSKILNFREAEIGTSVSLQSPYYKAPPSSTQLSQQVQFSSTSWSENWSEVVVNF